MNIYEVVFEDRFDPPLQFKGFVVATDLLDLDSRCTDLLTASKKKNLQLKHVTYVAPVAAMEITNSCWVCKPDHCIKV